MSNLYLIENNQNELINLLILENIKTENLITYDLENTNISNVIEDLDTYSMFESKKYIHATNASSLFKKSDIKHNIKSLINYIKNPSRDNILIISIDSLNIKTDQDQEKELLKLLKSNFEKIENNINLEDIARNLTKGYKFLKDDIRYLIELVNNDYPRLVNEINKLVLLNIDTKIITREQINLLVHQNQETNIFDLIDAIISKNKPKALDLFNNMINHGEEVIVIIALLANNIRKLYQMKLLKYSSNQEIMELLKLKSDKQIYAIKQKSNKYNEQELIKYIKLLSKLDEDIKLSNIDNNLAFSLFIMNL